MQYQQFRVGDYVKVRNIELKQRFEVAKITAMDLNNSKVFFYQKFIWPDSLPYGRLEHHSQSELIKSDETSKQFFNQIEGKVFIVSSVEDFLEQYSSHKKDTLFFFRQRLPEANNDSEQLVVLSPYPQLSPICICNKIFNPDTIIKDCGKDTPWTHYKKEIIDCPKCKYSHHASCLRQSYSKCCQNCNESMFHLLYHGEKKREIKAKEKQENGAILNINDDENEKQEIPVDDINQLSPMLLRKAQHFEYPSLQSKGLSQKLNKFIANHKAKMAKTIQASSDRDRARQNIIQNLSHPLYLAYLEICESGTKFTVFAPQKNVSEFQTDERLRQYIEKLAAELEGALYEQFNEISRAYGQKYREVLTSLKHEENAQLRAAIFNGKMRPVELFTIPKEELLPQSMRDLRDQKQRKYFQENVIVQTDKPAQVILKTKKGFETVQLYDRETGARIQEEWSQNPIPVRLNEDGTDAVDHIDNNNQVKQTFTQDSIKKRIENRIEKYLTAPQTKDHLMKYLDQKCLKID